jgi:hypothetical protein
MLGKHPTSGGILEFSADVGYSKNYEYSPVTKHRHGKSNINVVLQGKTLIISGNFRILKWRYVSTI